MTRAFDVATLDDMERDELLKLWETVMKVPAPRQMSMPFLRRFLAFELQARQCGGLAPGFLEKLTAAARADVRRPPRKLARGARLLREWNGETHVVDVTEAGFVWRGQTYRSLSVIARTITGAHWSGPRFFGLKAKAAA